MRCPHCKYSYNERKPRNEKTDRGPFYKLSNDIVAKRRLVGMDDERLVYFCPKCGKCFIEVW